MNISSISRAKEEFKDQLDSFLIDLRKRAENQFQYNLETNIPAGILKLDECSKNAIDHAIVSSINTRSKWDCTAAIEIASDILEDANCHSECAMLRKTLEN